MELTFTFAEIINKIDDLLLLSMESFVAVWLFAAVTVNFYPDPISLPTAPIITTPTVAALEIEPTPTEPASDIATVVTKLSYKSLRKLLSSLNVKYSGMNKESMVATLLSKITEEELDISLLLTTS